MIGTMTAVDQHLASAPPKLVSVEHAAGLIAPGDTVMVGGFGLVGQPLRLVAALLDSPHACKLTVISNNLGEPGRGLGALLLAGRIDCAVGSYFTSNPDAVRAHAEGTLQVRLMPQGTMAEAIRAGGAGITAFYVRTSTGTDLAGGKEVRVIDGDECVLEHALRADVALIRAKAADELGNLVYDKTARNFNPDMATAANLVIAEVDEIVPVGALDPEAVITPHLLIDHLVLTERRR